MLSTRFKKFIKYIFLPGSFIWLVLLSITVLIPNNPILRVLGDVLNVPYETLILKPLVGQGFNSFDTFMYGTMYYIFALCSFVSIVSGFFVLGKRKKWFEKFLLLQAFAIPRERINWGKVYDGFSNAPIAFATLRVIQKRDDRDVVLVSSVSDLDGKYRMYAQFEEGSYLLEVKANGYEVYSVSFETRKIGENILVNVPMKPLTSKLYSENPKDMTLSPAKQYRLLVIFLLSVSILSFAHSVYSSLFHFGMISILNLVFYGFAAPWNIYILVYRKLERPGRIVDQESSSPVQSAQVQLYREGRAVGSEVTNVSGIVQFDVEPGIYEIKISKSGYGVSAEIGVEDKMHIRITHHGFLDHNINLVPLNKGTDISGAMPNPFGS